MFIKLSMESKEPLYSQLVNQIIEGIAQKELHPGENLPSVRSLAQDLGINLHTVNKAYKQLEQNGFILIQRQKGALIHPDGIPKANKAYQEKLTASLRPIIAESICRGMDEVSFTKKCQEIFSSFQKKGESSK